MSQFETLRTKIATEYIDDKIREMKCFGWQVKDKTENKGRGKAYTRTKESFPVPVLARGVFYSTLTFKRQEDHRPTEKDIQDLENKYRQPGLFPALSIPILFTVICLIGSAMRIDWVYYVGVGLGLLWIFFSYKKQKQTRQKYIEIMERMRETFPSLQVKK